MIRTLLASAALATTLTAAPIATAIAAQQTAILAGGCFWCIEKDFEKVKGVVDVVSGYTGGTTANPTYKNHVAAGHREAVKVTYDDSKIDYATLLRIFYRSVDPTDAGGQFCDRGHSYTTAIYATTDAQLKTAKTVQAETEGVLGKPLATEITTAKPFTAAEDYHQNYASKNPIRYNFYRRSCGRDSGVKALWGEQAYQGIAKTS
ncbi:MAG: peptide-methionine (S)-S-oxide reductase MsrA [Ahrensia sp.]|nr:peptide-methionine (S)-S-oxide reductase MsrA [Ahrensia sp.]